MATTSLFSGWINFIYTNLNHLLPKTPLPVLVSFLLSSFAVEDSNVKRKATKDDTWYCKCIWPLDRTCLHMVQSQVIKAVENKVEFMKEARMGLDIIHIWSTWTFVLFLLIIFLFSDQDSEKSGAMVLTLKRETLIIFDQNITVFCFWYKGSSSLSKIISVFYRNKNT